MRDLSLCLPRGASASTLAIALALPVEAFAAQVCFHPLAGGAQCVKTFAVVSLVYALVASSYGLGALLIGKPHLRPGRLRLGLILVPIATWLAAMLGFTIGGALGLLEYPHDSSPFFFLDWFAAGFTLTVTTILVVALYRINREGARTPPASISA